MPAHLSTALALLPFACFLALRVHGAQPEGREAALSSSAGQTGELSEAAREVKPSVYYLKDKDGNLVLVPDFSFERYEELVRLEIAGNSSQAPLYSFPDVILIRGRTIGQCAELEIVVPLRLIGARSNPANGWTRVPLRLNQAILTKPPQLEGEGQIVMDPNSDREGYVAWVRAAAGSLQRVTFAARVPLVPSGGETRLSLVTPPTPTRLELACPGGQVEGRIGNSEEYLLVAQRVSDQSTLFTVEGTGGMLDLYWSEKHATPPVLEANGTVLVSVNGNRLECEARLKVRSSGSAIDSFTVRLPPEMELRPSSQPGLRVSLSPGMSAEDAAKSGQLVLVQKLDGKTLGPIDVQLSAWRPPELAQKKASISLAGFEVSDAVRQWGRYHFAIDGEWRVDWISGQNTRRVDEVPESARPATVAAHFEYFRQPFVLGVELQPKEPRLAVEPQYVLLVDGSEVRLEANLRCRTSGRRRPKSVSIDLTGWTVDRVLPEGIVDSPRPRSNVTPLVISLQNQLPPGVAEFTLRLEAHREFAVSSEPFTLRVPRLPDSDALPASVVIAPADSLELIPRAQDIVGLLPEVAAAPASFPDRRQLPLVYREESPGEGAVFVGDCRLRQRSVVVEVSSQVHVTEQLAEVEQRMMYEVSSEPLVELKLVLPRRFAESGALAVSIESGALPPPVWNREPDPRSSENAVAAFPLPAPILGRCAVTVRYVAPLSDLKPETPVTVVVPLAQPLEEVATLVSRNLLQVSTTEMLTADLRDTNWTLAATASPLGSGTHWNGVSEGHREAVTLRVTLVHARAHRATVLSQAWLQTWLGSRDRRDRAALRVRTDESQLQVQLPPHAHTDSVEVWIAGEPTSRFSVTNERLVRIDVGDHLPREFTLELFYWFTINEPLVAKMQLAAPALLGTDRACRCYWQVVLPENEYLFWAPQQLTRESSWRWLDFGWQRHSSFSEQELETRMGASRQQPLPAHTNGYLFSSLGRMTPHVLLTAKRHVLVFGLSGATLIAGLLLIYCPALRHPAALFLGGVVLLSAGFIYPDPAIMASQAAACGVALVLVARLLAWSLAPRYARGARMRGGSFTGPEPRAGELSPLAGGGSSRVEPAPTLSITAAEPPS